MPSAVQTEIRKEPSIIGQPLKRMEDPKFITGTGRYVDDISLPNILHGAFVRSPHAHARMLSVDVSKALRNPSVRLVLTAKDLADLTDEIPTIEWEEEAKATHRLALASGEVNFAGEAVALVVAADPASAEDAAELVQVDYEPLPVVVDPVKALEEDSPRVHHYLPDNLAYRTAINAGDINKAFREADFVIKTAHDCPRLSAVPLEPRDIIASFDSATNLLTVWVSCQAPHDFRDEVAQVLRLADSHVRVIAPDMGGGFGQKGFYAEHAAVCFAAMKLGRPVKWVESRRENLLAASHGRGQKQYVEAAVRKDGRVLGLKVKVICDGGAYTGFPTTMPEITVAMSTGVYDIEAFQGEGLTAFTNKTPIGPYRGASRPEAAYLIERTMNVIASRLKLDPIKVRMKNYVPKYKFPYHSAGGETYDTGDYEGNMNKALEVSKYQEMLTFQRGAREKGRLIGIGVSTYVEVCGFGPDSPQTATVTVTQHGNVIVIPGTNPHGQGHWTPFAQIVAEELGVDLNSIVVQYGDTAALPFSTITAGSRSAVVGGSAVLLAARKVRDKMGLIAALRLGVRNEGLVFRDSKIRSSTSPAKSITFQEVAEAAYSPEGLPPGMEATLFEYCAYAPPKMVYPFGTHITMVEVERETGMVKILKYVAVDDAGRILNPLVADGQVQGGTLQGISQALLEEIVYDENGQLLTSTLSDYPIPSTDTAPNIETYRTVTPTPLNPLGVKGIGEVGTIGATPAIVNAVEDALSPFGVTIEKLPLTPAYVWSLIQK